MACFRRLLDTVARTEWLGVSDLRMPKAVALPEMELKAVCRETWTSTWLSKCAPGNVL